MNFMVYMSGYLSVHRLNPGDKVILSSDGIKKVLSDQEILRIVDQARTPEEAEINLINEALKRGLKDDFQ